MTAQLNTGQLNTGQLNTGHVNTRQNSRVTAGGPGRGTGGCAVGAQSAAGSPCDSEMSAMIAIQAEAIASSTRRSLNGRPRRNTWK